MSVTRSSCKLHRSAMQTSASALRNWAFGCMVFAALTCTPPARAQAAAPAAAGQVSEANQAGAETFPPSAWEDAEGHGAAPESDAAGQGKIGKDKGVFTYKPGRWVTMNIAPETRLRLRLVVQPMMRFSHTDVGADDAVDALIRRARLGFDLKLPHQTGLRLELQVKNMHLGLSNLYGKYDLGKNTELRAGYIKAPGGLERDTYSFDEPFIERSVVAFLTYDHEMGFVLRGDLPSKKWKYEASISRDAPTGVDGGDPEDQPITPAGIEPEDVVRAASKWNAAGSFSATPSRAFEAGASFGVRLRPDEPDLGDRAAEPYDTAFLDPRPYKGTNFHVDLDAALSQPHFRLMGEGGYRRDGEQLDQETATQLLGSHLHATVGYLTFGITPHGRYGAAEDNAPLLDGWEVISRIEGARINPADALTATFWSVTSGVNYLVSPQLRLQADVAYETFGNGDLTGSTGARDGHRTFVQLWGTWRL